MNTMETHHLTVENQARLKSIIEINDKAFKIALKAYRRFPNGDYDLNTFCWLNFLERSTFNLEAVNVLIGQYQTKPSMEHSIGLLVRSSLLDFIINVYLASYYIDKNDSHLFTERLNGVLCDHLHNTFSNLEMVKNEGVLTQEQFNNSIDRLKMEFSYLFKESPIDYANPGRNLVIGRDKIDSVKGMYKRINAQIDTKKFGRAYDLYQYYSKYEHFGIMTHYFQKRGEDTNFKNMLWALHTMLVGMEHNLVFLNGQNTVADELKRMQELKSEFASLIPEELIDENS